LSQSQPAPAGNPRGLFCPVCRGVRLTVRNTKHPCAGVRIRYRVCTACETVLSTREVVVKVHRRGKKVP
jgi:hypothetical protein